MDFFFFTIFVISGKIEAYSKMMMKSSKRLICKAKMVWCEHQQNDF